jgi:hypothetical protein
MRNWVNGEMEPPTRQFIARMDAEVVQLFPRCVIPVCAATDDGSVQCGTGTLFRIAEASFLITATHVAELAMDPRRRLYITDAAPNAPPCLLYGDIHTEQNYDVSVWPLPEEVVARLANRKFLHLSEIDFGTSPLKQGWFYVHGHPTCWTPLDRTTNQLSTRPLTYRTTLYTGPTDTFCDYDPRVHVLIEVTKDSNFSSDGSPVVPLPELRGISGCSIWQAYVGGKSQEKWALHDVKVVAVQTGVHHGKGRDENGNETNVVAVKGTRWAVAFEILRKNYPELEPAIRLHLG